MTKSKINTVKLQKALQKFDSLDKANEALESNGRIVVGRHQLERFVRIHADVIERLMGRHPLATGRDEEVLFAWGSRSTSRVDRSEAAMDAARFTAVVVFPTPPF